MNAKLVLTVALVAGLVACAMALSANEKQIKYHKRVNAKFLTEKAKEDGVYKLPSGMLFKQVQKGDGKKSPTKDSDCDVHYSGTLKDGTKFDSSYDRGSPATFKPTQVIRGWTEALQLMSEGEKWTAYIPYDLAYGEQGSPPKIPGFSTLVFDIELLQVKNEEKSYDKAKKELQQKLGDKAEALF